MAWYSLACPHCGGDLHDDEDKEWVGYVKCFLCSRQFKKIDKQRITERVDENNQEE